MMDSGIRNRLPELVAILFRAGKVVPAEKLVAHFSCQPHELAVAVEEADAALRPLGLHISFAAGGYRVTTHPDTYYAVREFFTELKDSGLSPQALEVLAIVVYKQPVTRVEIEELRQVNSESPLHSLLQRRLIKVKGRSGQPGRPFLYATTERFLETFGLESLEDLPRIELAPPVNVEPENG